MSRLAVRALIASAALLFSSVGYAQTSPTITSSTYPSHPIRLIVPFPPGGPTDVMARLIAQQLSSGFGPIMIDNRPGAGSTIGARAAATAEADGYTLLFGSTSSLAIGPALYKNAGYDPVKTFEPVAMISSVPFILVVRPDLPVTSVQELIAYQRAHPGTLNFGAPNGTPPFLLIDLFKKKTNTDVVLIPYKGAAPVITDLLGSQLDATFETTSVILSYVRGGKVRALAVANPTRLHDLPDVPTLAESGVSDFIANSWTGIVAPVGTPADIVGKLNAAVNAGLRSPALHASFARLNAEAKIGTPQQFAVFIAEERQRWSEWVRLSGAQPD